MIQANELRIGNWVNTKEFHIKDVQGFYQVKADWLMYSRMFEPIPLTEEILLKCGFEKIHENGYYSTDDTHVVFILSCNNTLDATIDSHSILNENIKYLHQLQNLYFVLVGEELEINL